MSTGRLRKKPADVAETSPGITTPEPRAGLTAPLPGPFGPWSRRVVAAVVRARAEVDAVARECWRTVEQKEADGPRADGFHARVYDVARFLSVAMEEALSVAVVGTDAPNGNVDAVLIGGRVVFGVEGREIDDEDIQRGGKSSHVFPMAGIVDLDCLAGDEGGRP